MKRLLLTLAVLSSSLLGLSQVMYDTVSIGAGYSDQVWYSMESGIQATAPKAEWDLAFEITGFTSSIRINGATATELYVYPHGDTGAWSSLDTSHMGTWSASYNSDTSWAWGAFNVNASLSDPFDLGWGVYNFTTHHVVGDSIYVLKTSDGDYKKLWIVSLASGTYTFRIADIDGSNEIERTLAKGAFPDKAFGYYSIANDQTLNREPIRYNWDLLFTQYAALIPGFGAYPSTGILHNSGVQASRVYPVNDPEVFDDYASSNFHNEINTIGHQWKSINMSTFEWEIADSTVYFVRSLDGTIWKLVMRGFGGSADGNYMFSREKLREPIDTTTGVNEAIAREAFVQLYPNPATTNGMVNIVYDLNNSQTAELRITDMQGRVVHSERLSAQGLQTRPIATDRFPAGLYSVSVQTSKSITTKHLIIQ